MILNLLSILIIDDEEADRELLSSMLKKCYRGQCRISLAASAAEGQTLLQQEKFDCILLDVNLPDITGLDLLSSLQSKKNEIPVVMISGRTMADIEALRLGAAEFLNKNDINPSLLVTVIRHAIEKQKFISKLYNEQILTEFFLAILSHDLKNYIRSVKNFSDRLLEEKNQLSSALQEIPPIINKTVDSMSSLVDNILSICLLHKGKMSLFTEEFDLVKCVQFCISLFQPLAKEKNIELEFTSSSIQIPFNVNRDQLIQVLNNLLINAIKFTEKGRITVSLTDEGSFVTIVVKDTGCGISEEQIKYIFEPFEQTEVGKKKYGSGLGLYVARSIVQLHGGSLSVKSTVGSGSDFIISLPKKV